jgi:hypothetical protein
VARRDDRRELARTEPGAVEKADDPPVVARLVVEIRSDGRRTIARGAMEDVTGHGVAIEASGRTPLQLALSLAKTMITLPAFGRAAAKALLRGRRGGEAPRGPLAGARPEARSARSSDAGDAAAATTSDTIDVEAVELDGDGARDR